VTLEFFLLVGSILILASIAVARLSENLGVPTLLLFLGIGMLAGPEGPVGIRFADVDLAQSIGVIALILILFSGGLDTRWREVKPVFWQAASLATLGVLITAVAVGVFSSWALGTSLFGGLLLGAIISSTDAAAVFSVLRSRSLSLQGELKHLLELESGSNDPMAVFLTLGLLELLRTGLPTLPSVLGSFVLQMGLGGGLGILFGKGMVLALNRLRITHEGIYPVFLLAFAGLAYGFTTTIGGSGFLAVYVAGLVAGDTEFVQKRSLLRFFDGCAWLGQITMFLALGLLVIPSRVLAVAGVGMLISLFLMVVARPVSVFLSLALARRRWREKVFVSWIGLRGAVPVVLATFPLTAGYADAEILFDIVFFTVLTSALLQGWSILPAARFLRVDAPFEKRPRYPIEFAPQPGVDTQLVDLIVPFDSAVIGRSVVELGLPPDSLIVLISRDSDFLVPSGGTVLQGGDTLLVLVNPTNLPVVRSALTRRGDEAHEGPPPPSRHET
jgi:potassium/hydrogen antiporter